MGVTPNTRELLGAYALDAVDGEEAVAVAELVAEDVAARPGAASDPRGGGVDRRDRGAGAAA